MRRGLVHVVAWLLATGAAVTLSWWGVHTVMAGTAYDPPRAFSVTDPGGDEDGAAPSLASSTHRPEPSPSRSASAASPTRSKSASPSRTTPSAPPAPTSTAPTSSSSGTVKSYATDGGRAVFDLGATSATLVSATPGAGWSVQVWRQPTWIRVEFTSGTDKVSVFCTWHDHKPTVEVANY
ncbi:hypothetical protein [Streptomyces sp. VRA16 Mangrove soil]|uniref:hypothetical protein n=1 Tax=Streptomyces sp. VRA16 Mangrove soil TaxID=2817434 RepID=UPI001A9FE3BA|nr:hypothetical protein [Streptomyces sp. VRA16 Mangrove soil]MBO1334231.1 hypothetical protein [Streptomyces sp. VRA16 Mangrove soil]